MTLKYYIITMMAGTLMAWAAFLWVINYLSPTEAGVQGLIFFYVSLFLSLMGTTVIIGFLWRYWRHSDETLSRHVSISFRQGLLLGLMAIGTLYLQKNELLTWWNLTLMIVGVTTLEFLWLSNRRFPPSDL